MKKMFLCIGVVFLFVSLLSCSPEQKTDDEIVARINDRALTLGECQRQMAMAVDLHEDYKLTQEAQGKILEELIRKELLIQEAKRLHLDRKENFVRAIERYWESTLIRNLMEMKGEELSQRILVTEDEIRAVYNETKNRKTQLEPLDELRDEIARRIREDKKTAMLLDWIDDLRRKADVEINEGLLYKR